LLAGQDKNQIDDSELVSLASNGDTRAFETLLERHRSRLLRICLRMLGDRIEAEEAAQDSFVKIYYHLRDYDTSRSFSVWSASIALNECRDRLRRRTRLGRLFRGIEEADRAQGAEETNDADESQEKLNAVEKALTRLPEQLREVITLKAYGEHSYEEIAKILNVRIGTVMSRLFRARQKLTDIINRGI
jgi:RNA polymerase sigma factor (sigma-70 family)